jgi:pimeloyl-ACP methyl ester carboxylesterase
MAVVLRTDRYDVAGPDAAPAIVFLHGSVVTRTIWRLQLSDLGDDFRVIAPDLPGHGRRAATPFTFESAIAESADLIAAEATRAIVVGLSLGGYVAMLLAAQRPELVSGLVVCGASANFTGALGLYLKAVAWILGRGWMVPSPARLETRTRALFPPSLADVADLQIQDGLYPAALAPAFATMARTNFLKAVARFDGPVLFLNGQHDRPTRRGEAAFAAAACHARVETIAGAGHACNLQSPELFNAAVRTFARTVVLEGSPGI